MKTAMFCPHLCAHARALKAKPSIAHAYFEIQGQKEGLDATYTTYDRIEGNIVLKVMEETKIDQIRITFEALTKYQGSSVTTVRRTVPFVPGRRGASHTFLRFRQPTDSSEYANSTYLVPGKVYKFPFAFTIPARLKYCKHDTQHDDVNDTHSLLPPTLGRATSNLLDLNDSEMTTNACKITYALKAYISQCQSSTDTSPSILCDISKTIRVIPATVLDVCRAENPKKHIIPKNMRSERTQGRLQLRAEQPEPVQIASYKTQNDDIATTTIKLQVQYDPEKNEQPPRLINLRSSLEVATHYATVPWEDYPSAQDLNTCDRNQEARVVTVPLSSLDLSSIKWEKIPSLSNALPETDESGVSKPCSYLAYVTVPVVMPSDKHFVPTFHSCLISRTYAVGISLNYRSSSAFCSSNVKLTTSLEVGYGC
ncbi:S-antigen N-terminal domain protein [Penicillium macrosclerotiorum]|uniref:S-antigen N-terminal domain protein n=1 Tax=Penicillium macrosclerotiorum TaxID=303699 RepID=UPI00254848E8|nr:S-antigen N-terminal domain protein [Penicillium macrosclerotiorum]KAJ5666815.1 S-antigen N-terminal domain protein [Penicillium macrosclerotiorum]